MHLTLGVHPSTESSSTVCITPQSHTPRCASHRGVKFCSVLPTPESSSTVCITPWSQTAHRRVKIGIFFSLWLVLTLSDRQKKIYQNLMRFKYVTVKNK